jgi:hypothetical protein
MRASEGVLFRIAKIAFILYEINDFYQKVRMHDEETKESFIMSFMSFAIH